MQLLIFIETNANIVFTKCIQNHVKNISVTVKKICTSALKLRYLDACNLRAI